MEEKIVLVDGNSILNRAFYGVPTLTDSKGRHTNAVYGFLNILCKLLDEEQPQYLAVAFDVKAPTFRHKMYANYKGTRKPMPEELKEQLPLIKEVLQTMHIKIIEKEGLEADDLIGTMAKRMEKEGLRVSILSGDRDLLQLVSEHITMRLPHTSAGNTTIDIFTPQAVFEKYQLTPLQIIELKSLMGDSSDNIPGVPSIGEKTATKILLEFSTLENAISHIEEIKPPRAKKALEENIELARLSKTLATIEINADFSCEKEECMLKDMWNETAFLLMKSLEFKSLLNKFSNAQTPDANEFAKHIQTIQDLTEAEKLLASVQGRAGIQLYARNSQNENEQMTFDFLQTKQTSALLGLALSKDDKESYFILSNEQISDEFLMESIQKLVQEKVVLSFINLKEQLHHMEFLEEGEVFDCQIAAYLLNPLKDTYYYDDIARDYLGVDLPSQKELLGKQSLEEAFDSNFENFLKVACFTAKVAFLSMEELFSQLQQTDMDKLYQTIELPVTYPLYYMEKYGVMVKAQALKEYGEELSVHIKGLESEIYEAVGEVFNIQSPKQLGAILFEKMGIPGGKKTKTGYSTSAEVLERLAGDYPFVEKILEYRQLTKLKSTYADGLSNYIGMDSRIHGKFNQTITATGRISSTEPNLQNIPIRMEIGRAIRKVFVPMEQYVFLDADYSQIELRILADASADENLIDAYNSSMDIHQITASKVFHVPLEEVTPQLRRNAKAVNFGIVYGISSFGLSNDLSISRKEAAEYIEQYFETYPKIKQFLDEKIAQAKKNGYISTLFGRRRPIPELKSSNYMQRSFGERIAMNSPIQGTAADIMKIATVNVYRELKKQQLKSRIVLQVHDELLVETYIEEIEQVKQILEQQMRTAADLKVALEVEVNQGDNWLEAH